MAKASTDLKQISVIKNNNNNKLLIIKIITLTVPTNIPLLAVALCAVISNLECLSSDSDTLSLVSEPVTNHTPLQLSF